MKAGFFPSHYPNSRGHFMWTTPPFSSDRSCSMGMWLLCCFKYIAATIWIWNVDQNKAWPHPLTVMATLIQLNSYCEETNTENNTARSSLIGLRCGKRRSSTAYRMCTLTVIAPYTIIALMVSIRREMANPTQAFSVGGKTWRSCEEHAKNVIGQLHC